ncbi:MAG TPA: periplasmic heavy metal sensor [Blastocatellia bacterium]|nr:periplasmic heavy metal sensor [Blastocatellia bacterium]
MRSIIYALGILLLSFGAVRAQQQPQPDPFAGNLFPPELIMQYQQALGLSEEQKNLLKAELSKLQTRLSELQWDLQGEMEKLAALVKQDQADEAQALTQLDKVLSLEREIKRAHIGLLIRIKNRLTPEQQAKLREIQGKPAAK